MNHAKLKVALFISSMDVGGAERVVSLLLKEFLKTYNVTLMLLEQKINYPIPDDVSIVTLRNYQKYLGRFLSLPFFAWQYKKICEQLEIDVSLSFLNRPNYIAILAKLMGLHVKLVISERAMPTLQHRCGLKGFINRLMIKFLYPKADEIVVNSYRNLLVLNEMLKVHSVKIIHNPTSFLNISFETMKRSDPFTFITIGRLDDGKNHQMLIDVMCKLNARLWIIGEGVMKDSLAKSIVALDLQDKVILLGYQANPELWLHQANAFVFSSLHEGFPNVLLEALACGLPIISTDCLAGPREILAPKTDYTYQMKSGVEEAEFGILVPIHDVDAMREAMSRCLHNKTLREHYTHKALKRAQDFSIEPIVKQWRDILERKVSCVES